MQIGIIQMLCNQSKIKWSVKLLRITQTTSHIQVVWFLVIR